MNAPCLFKAPCSTSMALILLSFHLSQAAFSQSVVLEDWDSTPAVPDEVRGWGSVEGPAELESGLGTGNFARARRIFILPNALTVPVGNDPSTWFSNDFVGDKDYAALGVSKVSYLARHDEVMSTIQIQAVPTSFVLSSEEMVPDPEDPSNTIFPLIWKVSDNEMTLGGGWTQFEFEIPSQSPALPPGWRAYPDEPSTWTSVISDVDQVGVVFTRFDIGIGGIQAVWENAIDDFTVEIGEAQAVPVASCWALTILIVGLLGLGQLAAHRRLGA